MKKLKAICKELEVNILNYSLLIIYLVSALFLFEGFLKLVFLLICSITFIAALILKISLQEKSNYQNIEHEFCFVLAYNLKLGNHLSHSYFQATKVLQKYEKELYTLDELRLDSDLIDKYGFLENNISLKELLVEDDFFHLSTNKYQLFITKTMEKEKERMEFLNYKKRIDLSLKIVVFLFALFNIVLLIIKKPLLNPYILILMIANIIMGIILFEEIYEKIKV